MVDQFRGRRVTPREVSRAAKEYTAALQSKKTWEVAVPLIID